MRGPGCLLSLTCGSSSWAHLRHGLGHCVSSQAVTQIPSLAPTARPASSLRSLRTVLDLLKKPR